MSKWIEIIDRGIHRLIPNKNICWLEWVEKDEVIHLIIHMSPEDRGIAIPENQSAKVLQAIKEFFDDEINPNGVGGKGD